MKKRILSLTLVLCMLLPILPLSAFAATVEGLSYDSPYARDVWFGDVPTTSWYQGLGGDQYGTAYNGTAFGVNTTYADYMTAFDAMFPFADAIITDREDLVPNYSAEIYDQVPADVAAAMNTTTLNGYVTREVLGMARESCHKEYNEVQYMYAYTLDPTQEPGYNGPDNLPKIFLCSGTQSDELGAVYGLYFFVYDLLNNYENDPVLSYLRKNVKFVITPCISPGGINQKTYWNANYVNINRNYESENFQQVGGFDFVEDENGEWVPQEKTYVDKEGVTLTVTRYVKAEDGNGTHRQVKTWTGLFNAEGDTLGSKWTHTQCSGYEPFDQAESCAIRDLLAKHMDAFLFIDYHTNTSGPLSKGAWLNLNWLSLEAFSDTYEAKMLNAANWHIDRYSQNVFRDYNLADHGVKENQIIANATTSGGTSSVGGAASGWVRRQKILSMTLESISGFPKTDAYPDGCLGGRYSPATQKLGSEVLGNWLIAVLAEYAYDGDVPTEAYSTYFAPMAGNYPTLGGFDMKKNGAPDLSVLPSVNSGSDIFKLDEATYPVTFNGGWEVGYTLINSDASFKGDANFTPFNTLYYYDGNRLFLTDSNSQWAVHGGLRVGVASNSSAQNWASAWKTATGWLADTTVRYTAEFGGKIAIDIKDLLFMTNSCKLVILKNGTPVYEIIADTNASQKVLKTTTADDGTVTYSWKSGNVIPQRGHVELSVVAGDKIDFVTHYHDIGIPTTASIFKETREGIKDYDFRISYYQDNNSDLTVTYSGLSDALTITKPSLSADILPFLKWYADENSAAMSSGDVSNATARINPALLGTWIANDATWTEAIEGYKNYLRSLSSVSSASGWLPGSFEVADNPYAGGTVFVPITALSFLSKNAAAANIFDASTTGKNMVHAFAFDTTSQYMVSKTYFDAQVDAFCAPAEGISVSGTGADIRIPFSLIAGVETPVINGPASGITDSTTAFVGGLDLRDTQNYAGKNLQGVILHAHYDFNATNTGQKAVGLQYIVPEGVSGNATLNISDIFYGMSSSDSELYRFALFLNGETLIANTKVTRDTDASDGRSDLDTIKAKLDALGSFTVKPGDRIEIRFRQDGQYNRVSLSPVVSLTIKKENTMMANYSGTLDALTIMKPTKSAEVEPLFKWYNGETLLTNGDASNATARINPALLGTWIASDAKWADVIEGYKNYLRSLSSVKSASGWIPGSMETEGNAYLGGNTFVPFTSLSFLSKNDAAQNIFGVSTVGKNIIHSMAFDSGAQFMVSEQYFEAQLERYCAPAAGMTVAEAAADIRIPFSALPSVTTAVGQPLTNGVTGSSKTTVVGALDLRNGGALLQVWNDQNNTNSRSKAVALQYVVPNGVNGKAKLNLTDIFYGMTSTDANVIGTYRFGVFVNGEYLFGADRNGYIKVTRDLDGDATRTDLNLINETLNALGSFEVKAGDRIEVRFLHEWANCYVSLNPAINLTIEKELNDAPMRLVAFANGGAVAKRQLAAKGTSVADLIAAYRKTDADFAANGCYINGTWYAADAELPEIGGYDVIIDDFKIAATTNIAIGSTYAMNVSLPAISGVTEAGVKVGSEKIAGVKNGENYKVTVATVYAKDLLDTAVYVTPYYVINGKEALGQGMTLRAVDMLNTYISGEYPQTAKALAQAALDYATVAKAYFAGAEVDADVVARLAGYDSQITGNTTTQVTAGTDYTFTAASLQIGETINFVLAVTAANGASVADLKEDLTLYRNGSVMPIADEEAILTYVNGKRALAIVVKGVPEKEFANAQTFSLADGATLTYSVKDYCIRTLNSAEEAEKNMIRAVYAIGQAAEAYEG